MVNGDKVISLNMVTRNSSYMINFLKKIMNPIIKIFSSFLIGCSLLNYAQSVSFENINSNNVLNMLSQISNNVDVSKNSAINMQIGNQNYAEIKANSQTQLSALQFGDYNYLNFDNSFQKDKAKSTITTQGNNNIIDVVGSNSISDKMQIHLKGDNMTVFMRNY